MTVRPISRGPPLEASAVENRLQGRLCLTVKLGRAAGMLGANWGTASPSRTLVAGTRGAGPVYENVISGGAS